MAWRCPEHWLPGPPETRFWLCRFWVEKSPESTSERSSPRPSGEPQTAKTEDEVL